MRPCSARAQGEPSPTQDRSTAAASSPPPYLNHSQSHQGREEEFSILASLTGQPVGRDWTGRTQPLSPHPSSQFLETLVFANGSPRIGCISHAGSDPVQLEPPTVHAPLRRFDPEFPEHTSQQLSDGLHTVAPDNPRPTSQRSTDLN